MGKRPVQMHDAGMSTEQTPFLELDDEGQLDRVCAWHGDKGREDISEFLGITREQYADWVEGQCAAAQEEDLRRRIKKGLETQHSEVAIGYANMMGVTKLELHRGDDENR
jgi:hypothetical protein